MLAGRRRRGLRRRRPPGRRGARRAGDPPADAVDAGELLERPSADGGAGELVLFVVADLDDALRRRISTALRTQLSPRHVPDTIAAVPAIPRTLTGKKLEAPVKRILSGEPAERVASRGALPDPDAIAAFVEFARARGR